jgi:aspartyl-tRNA(Asn)/glutamyl-tRNA(Gln) amidotransferase subunit C
MATAGVAGPRPVPFRGIWRLVTPRYFTGTETLTRALGLHRDMSDSDGEGGDRVDPATVRHVGDLARVDLDESEVERFAEQFAAILDHFEALEEVPETEREPDLVNVMRADEVAESLSQAEALRNAPETEDGKFKGPRVG